MYIEDGVFSVARVASVRASDQGMEAVLERIPELPLVCFYRETPPRFADAIPTQGEHGYPSSARWEIFKTWDMLFIDHDVWDGSLQMGFRILFAPEVVARFLSRDLSWIGDYF